MHLSVQTKIREHKDKTRMKLPVVKTPAGDAALLDGLDTVVQGNLRG